MINKILVFGGAALLAILIIENMVVPSQAYLFISSQSTAFMLATVCSFIGMGIGYGIHGFLHTDKEEYVD